MDINRAALGALAVVGIVAVGSSACNANRQPDGQSAAAVRGGNAPAVAGSVNETENTIAPAPAVPAGTVTQPADVAKPAESVHSNVPAPRPAPAPASVRRQPAAPRTQPAARAPARAEQSRPASQAPAPSSNASSAPADPQVNAAIEPLDSTTVERAPYVPPVPQKQYEELVLPADSVIGLQIDNAITSERAKVEDQVRARVTRDVKVRDHVAIPAGARAEGSITLVDKGGRLKDQARLGIRFHTIVLADGTRLPINTETIYRDGESPTKESAAKIGGGAVGGAVLGAILGGKKGAIIGSTVGAGAGGAAVAASEPNAATLPAGSTVTVRMSAPATVTVEK
jgi:hypothetical protein